MYYIVLFSIQVNGDMIPKLDERKKNNGHSNICQQIYQALPYL